jgi:hypothetical protein
MAVRMQAIEFTTTKIDEIEALVRARRGRVGAAVIHGSVMARRDRPGTYLTIVESASDLSSTDESGRCEVGRLLADLASLCECQPELYDLAVGSIPEPRAPTDPVGRPTSHVPGWMT